MKRPVYGNGFGGAPASKLARGGDGGSDGTVGEVRFKTPEEASEALSMDGVEFEGSVINVEIDPASHDSTKLIISNLRPGTAWQDLKSAFGDYGAVMFAGIAKSGKGSQSSQGRGGRPTRTGEVRYETPEEADAAIASLDGADMNGFPITMVADRSSKDSTKVVVSGIPPGVDWQDLKEFCLQAGNVAYAKVMDAGPQMSRQPVMSRHPPMAGRAGPMAVAGHKGARPSALPAKGGGKNSYADYVAAAWATYNSGPTAAPAAHRAGPSRPVGEVRYASPEFAARALSELNGQSLKGERVRVKADLTSHDGAKVLVLGLPHNINWQDLKDFMSSVGDVSFAKINQPSTGGGAPPPAPSAFARPPVSYFGASSPRASQPPQTVVGEVRFEDPADAQEAISRFDGTFVGRSQVTVEIDRSSQDGAKVAVHGLQPNFKWQELKDIFQEVGRVAYAGMRSSSRGGPSPMLSTARDAAPSRSAKPRIRSSAGSSGEIRYADVASTQAALQTLNGANFKDSAIELQEDPKSQDGSKIMVTNLPVGIEWQELKEFFAQCGEVAYAGIIGPGEVRMSTADEAEEAVDRLNGSVMDGHTISVELDPNSVDRTKLIVDYLPPTVQWQELKDLFQSVGKVMYAKREK
eukprot:TRINITY_DN23011_c0_g1_i1.p1 TRINITY_DN23011_c0_g1~~TRINITY_DN23011_c0_g1_i1.p1  ORF type:complete len:635 (-),score=125.90 TRINITY_DN23011_c0_g1_i1:97-2001(-)